MINEPIILTVQDKAYMLFNRGINFPKNTEVLINTNFSEWMDEVKDKLSVEALDSIKKQKSNLSNLSKKLLNGDKSVSPSLIKVFENIYNYLLNERTEMETVEGIQKVITKLSSLLLFARDKGYIINSRNFLHENLYFLFNEVLTWKLNANCIERRCFLANRLNDDIHDYLDESLLHFFKDFLWISSDNNYSSYITSLIINNILMQIELPVKESNYYLFIIAVSTFKNAAIAEQVEKNLISISKNRNGIIDIIDNVTDSRENEKVLTIQNFFSNPNNILDKDEEKSRNSIEIPNTAVVLGRSVFSDKLELNDVYEDICDILDSSEINDYFKNKSISYELSENDIGNILKNKNVEVTKLAVNNKGEIKFFTIIKKDTPENGDCKYILMKSDKDSNIYGISSPRPESGKRKVINIEPNKKMEYKFSV